MGKSNGILRPIYKKLVENAASQFNEKIEVAVLGSPGPYIATNFIDNANFSYFDLKLKNWNINDDWILPKKFDFIICTRCPYFSKDPKNFIIKCHEHLHKKGVLLLDWGYGDHWRFPQYKIGWIKNGEQEYCYEKENYLWSGVWDDEFVKDAQFQQFTQWVKKKGYNDVKKAIFDETPIVLKISFIKQYFNCKASLLSLWEQSPQLYVFLICKKKQKG